MSFEKIRLERTAATSAQKQVDEWLGHIHPSTHQHFSQKKLAILSALFSVWKELDDSNEWGLGAAEFDWLDVRKMNAMIALSSFSLDARQREMRHTYLKFFVYNNVVVRVTVWDFKPHSSLCQKFVFVLPDGPVGEESMFVAPVGKFRVVEFSLSEMTQSMDDDLAGAVLGDYANLSDAEEVFKERSFYRIVVNDRGRRVCPPEKENEK